MLVRADALRKARFHCLALLLTCYLTPPIVLAAGMKVKKAEFSTEVDLDKTSSRARDLVARTGVFDRKVPPGAMLWFPSKEEKWQQRVCLGRSSTSERGLLLMPPSNHKYSTSERSKWNFSSFLKSLSTKYKNIKIKSLQSQDLLFKKLHLSILPKNTGRRGFQRRRSNGRRPHKRVTAPQLNSNNDLDWVENDYYDGPDVITPYQFSIKCYNIIKCSGLKNTTSYSNQGISNSNAPNCFGESRGNSLLVVTLFPSTAGPKDMVLSNVNIEDDLAPDAFSLQSYFFDLAYTKNTGPLFKVKVSYQVFTGDEISALPNNNNFSEGNNFGFATKASSKDVSTSTTTSPTSQCPFPKESISPINALKSCLSEDSKNNLKCMLRLDLRVDFRCGSGTPQGREGNLSSSEMGFVGTVKRCKANMNAGKTRRSSTGAPKGSRAKAIAEMTRRRGFLGAPKRFFNKTRAEITWRAKKIVPSMFPIMLWTAIRGSPQTMQS